jgi:hypothetical protein
MSIEVGMLVLVLTEHQDDFVVLNLLEHNNLRLDLSASP